MSSELRIVEVPIRSDGYRLTCAIFSPEPGFLGVLSDSGPARLFSLPGQEIDLPFNDVVNAIAFCPDNDHRPSEIDFCTKTGIMRFDPNLEASLANIEIYNATDICFSPDSKMMAVASEGEDADGGIVSVWQSTKNIATEKPFVEFKGRHEIRGLAFGIRRDDLLENWVYLNDCVWTVEEGRVCRCSLNSNSFGKAEQVFVPYGEYDMRVSEKTNLDCQTLSAWNKGPTTAFAGIGNVAWLLNGSGAVFKMQTQLGKYIHSIDLYPHWQVLAMGELGAEVWCPAPPYCIKRIPTPEGKRLLGGHIYRTGDDAFTLYLALTSDEE